MSNHDTIGILSSAVAALTNLGNSLRGSRDEAIEARLYIATAYRLSQTNAPMTSLAHEAADLEHAIADLLRRQEILQDKVIQVISAIRS